MTLFAPLGGQSFRRNNKSQIITVPPPTAGWVSLADAKSNDLNTAHILRNMVPRRTTVETRLGCVEVDNLNNGMPVETLMSFQDGGLSKAFCASDDSIYEFTVSAAGTLQQGTAIISGLNSARFQWVCTANAADEMRLVMVNGADGIHVWDNANGIKKLTTAPDVPDLLDVTTHKTRLFFTELGTTDIWYGPPLSNEPPTLTPLPIGAILRKGGSCLAIDTLSLDGGSGPDDYLVIVTTEGECVVFRGVDPATDFQLVGVFHISKPMGVRCLAKLGKDLMYYSDLGPEMLGKLFGGLGYVDRLGVPIQDEFERRTQTNPNAFGWDMLHYHKDSWVIFNVPVLPPTEMRQYVMNIENNAWFEITGWNAHSWIEHEGELYYGDNEGKIFRANWGQTDNGAPYIADYMANWHDFGSPVLKKFNLVEMTFRSTRKPVFQADMLTDYEIKEPQFITEIPGFAEGSPWDVSAWDVSPWGGFPRFIRDTFGIPAMGHMGAFRYSEQVFESYTELRNYRIVAEAGEII